MIPEAEYLVSEYMGWDDTNPEAEIPLLHQFDLNDASLVVAKLVTDDDWINFFEVSLRYYLFSANCDQLALFTAWFLDPKSFFAAVAMWLKTERRNEDEYV